MSHPILADTSVSSPLDGDHEVAMKRRRGEAAEAGSSEALAPCAATSSGGVSTGSKKRKASAATPSEDSILATQDEGRSEDVVKVAAAGCGGPVPECDHARSGGPLAHAPPVLAPDQHAFTLCKPDLTQRSFHLPDGSLVQYYPCFVRRSADALLAHLKAQPFWIRGIYRMWGKDVPTVRGGSHFAFQLFLP